MRILLDYSLIVSLLFVWSEGLSSSSSYDKTTRNIATQTLQGAGPASVDLNQYNLPLNQIEDEWTAKFVQKTAEKEQGVFIGAKNERSIFVDAIMVSFPRSKDAGLGIELTELAGGRDDGLGITVVTGLVPGGSADGAGSLPGDSITEVSIVRMKRQTGGNSLLEEKQQQWNVRTECFSYDATVDAILSLPSSVEGYDDFFTLKLKRLRRKPKVTVKLQYPPEQNEPDTTIEMFAGENLRQGMLVRGVKLNDPLAQRFDTKSEGNCGAGGLCRTCSVSILNGGELLNPQRVAESQMLRDTPQWRLACKAIVGFGMKEGEMTVRVNPRQW
jgi:ferredoxin